MAVTFKEFIRFYALNFLLSLFKLSPQTAVHALAIPPSPFLALRNESPTYSICAACVDEVHLLLLVPP
jgi:hypothetical protein